MTTNKRYGIGSLEEEIRRMREVACAVDHNGEPVDPGPVADPVEPNTLNEGEETTLEEGFGMWEISFAAGTVDGVELDPKKVYKVKARISSEAIKKAAKQAGIGGSWLVAPIASMKSV